MGFLDRIKRTLRSNKNIAKEVSMTKIKQSELPNWIKSKKKETAESESSLLKQIKNRTSQLANELESEVNTLEEIDVSKLKAPQEKARLITKKNLEHYIEHLRSLIETLQKLELSTTDNLLRKITSIFKDFEKKSFKNFQKAAFLCGDKLSDIRVSTGKFFKDLRNIMKNNEPMLNKSKRIYSIDSKLDEINIFEKTKLKFKEKIDGINREITKFKGENKDTEKNIEKVKKSKSYAKLVKKRTELENNKTELKKKIDELRTVLDFKLLANTFHSNAKKMKIVKDYKSNFKEAFQKDGGTKLTALIEEIEDKDQIITKINEINQLKKKIERNSSEKDEIDVLKDRIKKTNSKIQTLKSKKAVEQKKIDKFQTKREKILNSIRDDLGKINVELK